MKNLRSILPLLCLSIMFAFSCLAGDNLTARVIYSEAGPTCSSGERLMVASVIKNRIGHSGFGYQKSMEAVVTAKHQFSCINDPENSNWLASAEAPNSKAWSQAVALSKGNFTPVTNAVYYHDKSISKPANWDNKYWRTVKTAETKNFVFYAVEAKPKLVRGKSLAKL